MIMPNKKPIFSFGKFDSRDVLHFGLGLCLYTFAYFVCWLIFSEPKYYAISVTVLAAALWEVRQRVVYGASIDIKDIIVSSISGLLFTLII